MCFALGDSGSGAQTLREWDEAVTDQEGKGICLGGERNASATYNMDLPEKATVSPQDRAPHSTLCTPASGRIIYGSTAL